MSHRFRFFVPGAFSSGVQLELAGEEAHHALHVVRVRPGDDVDLFDGCGREASGVIRTVSKREVGVEITETRSILKPPLELTLCPAWLKRGKCIEFLVQHGTELGVSRFAFFRAEHSEKAPAVDPKWERWAIEALKQCKGAWLPRFEVFGSLADCIAHTEGLLLVATQDVPVRSVETMPERVRLFVGPEGDFTETELALFARAGAVPLSLGAHTFRAEMAALVASMKVLNEGGALGPRLV